MYKCVINTDFNGIVIFEPYRLIEYFGGSIAPGTDLFTVFRSTDQGDDVLKRGIVIPILAIDDASYTLEFLIDEASTRPSADIKFSNGIFPLQVEQRLVAADLVVFKEWEDNLGWIDIPVPSGIYAANIRGFRTRDTSDDIIDFGYEISLKTVDKIPAVSGTTDINARVFD